LKKRQQSEIILLIVTHSLEYSLNAHICTRERLCDTLSVLFNPTESIVMHLGV